MENQATALNGNTPTESGILMTIPVSRIKLNPDNYRKFYDEDALITLAKQLKLHGVISSLMVKPAKNGKYELVVGERRYRAAKLAGLNEVPAKVVDLTDEQVTEIQLNENLQREDPHPLHEAEAIQLLLKSGKNIEEISLRLGKSKGFIYSRIKLSELADPIKEMFFAGKISIKEATEIASLSTDSQNEFFGEFCKDWKTKGIRLNGLSYTLDRYRFDLKAAPFNTRDGKLYPEAGACTKCPYNSATLKSLFPEMAKSAVCSNKECFKQKCALSLEKELTRITKDKEFTALLLSNELSAEQASVIEKFPGLSDLPIISYYEVRNHYMPTPPDKEDFYIQTESGRMKRDVSGFKQAKEEYGANLEAFELAVQNGDIHLGLKVKGFTAEIQWFSKGQRNTATNTVSAKAVQQALKDGTVTAELLRQEIERLESREARSVEIDAEKIQLAIHGGFLETYGDIGNVRKMTQADHAAMRFLIFQTLDYTKKKRVAETLFPDLEQHLFSDNAKAHELFAGLDSKQTAYLVRMAIANDSDSKYPRNTSAYMLYRAAESAGFDIETITNAQAEIARKRLERLNERKVDLEAKIADLSASESPTGSEE